MLSMDMLPVELWVAVISHLSCEDLRQFRLCSSRTALAIINRFYSTVTYIL